MSETILSIEEYEGGTRWSSEAGFKVKTTKQEILLAIDNEASCCESWGWFWTNDKPEDFIGAELLDVTITDECLVTSKAPDVYDGGVMFVNLETDRGKLQFVAYNDHNGYYGHEARVVSTQLEHSETL